jgi:two-component system LytT family response regulator
MIKALIIDDEQHCSDRLASLLKKNHASEVEIMQICSTVTEGLKAIRELAPGLVFLDVQINDRTGFDLLEEAAPVMFKIIFTTAYDRFAIQAIKHSAIGYLLKPIDEDDLAEALNKLTQSPLEQMETMAQVLRHNLNQNNKRKRIIVPSGNELIFMEIDDIVRCQSDVNYTTIFKTDKSKIVVAKTLKDFEEILVPHEFFRIHNSHLINLSCIKSYNKGKGGSVTLTDGTELEVSTRRKDEFLKIMAAF